MSPQGHRRHAWPVYPRAVAVAVILAVVWCALMAGSCVGRVPEVALMETEQLAAQAFESSVAEEDLAELAAWRVRYGGGDVDAFCAQVADFAEWDITVSSDGTTACLIWAGGVGEAMVELRRCMEEAGWSSIDSGSSFACTFVREGTSADWAAATLSQIGGSTTVVLTKA